MIISCKAAETCAPVKLLERLRALSEDLRIAQAEAEVLSTQKKVPRITSPSSLHTYPTHLLILFSGLRRVL